MSVFTTVFAGSMPVGGLLTGALASTAGIAVAVATGGALALAVGLISLVWLRRQPMDVMRPPEVARPGRVVPPAQPGDPVGPGEAVAQTAARTR
jgi:hypothetical protein